jgi:hypothetical protein
MRIPLLVLTLTATVVSADGSVAAQADDLRWSGIVAQGKTIEIRGVHGSIRTMSSEDALIHVDARRSDPASVRIEVVEHVDGVTVCAVYLGVTERAPEECRRGVRENAVQNNDARVDFVVRVPAGVHFAASMINGDIEVERLRSEVNVATIHGNVNIQTAGFAAHATTIDGNVVLDLPADTNADFHGITVAGTIDSDFPVASTVPPPPPTVLLPNGSLVGPIPPRPPQVVRATLGSGGPEFGVTTVNGSIHLRRR